MCIPIYSGLKKKPHRTSLARIMTALRSFFQHSLPQAFFGAVEATAKNAPSPLESLEFSHAFVALVAKLSVVDGAPNTLEFFAFDRLVAQLPRADASRLRSLFLKRLNDDSSAAQYARRIASLTGADHALHEDIFRQLLGVARADGPLHASELALLSEIADFLAIPEAAASALAAESPVTLSPHAVLGVPRDASLKEVRAAYLRQVRQLHPDRHAGAPDAAAYSHHLARVNAAYDEIQRGVSPLPRTNTKGATAS